jgi:hypothetical protein
MPRNFRVVLDIGDTHKWKTIPRAVTFREVI